MAHKLVLGLIVMSDSLQLKICCDFVKFNKHPFRTPTLRWLFSHRKKRTQRVHPVPCALLSKNKFSFQKVMTSGRGA